MVGSECCELVRDSIVRGSLGYERRQIGVTLQCISELLFESDKRFRLMAADAGGTGELVLVPEDAELAGTPSEAHEVTRVGPDAVFLQYIPDLLLFPVPDGAEAVDIPEGVPTVPQVSLVWFEDGVAGPLFALFSAFSGEHEGALPFEALVVPEGRGADVYLQVGAAPADAQIRGRLRETASGRRLASLSPVCLTVPSGISKQMGAVRALSRSISRVNPPTFH